MKNKILAAVLLSAISAPALADNMYMAADLGSTTYENMAPFPNPGKLGFGLGFRISPTIAASAGLDHIRRFDH